MKTALLAAALAALLGAPSTAALVEAPAASSFPSDYLHSVSLSLAAQPFYASYFLNSFQTQLTAVAAFPAAPAAAAYLEHAATGGSQTTADLRASLGHDELSPEKASALLIANSLVRPEQFREVMDGLETLKPGLGRHAAAAMRDASGPGNGKILAALHAAGERRPQAEGLTYGPDGRWATLFDGSRAPRDGDGPAPSARGADYIDAVVVDAPPRDDAARARLPALTKPQPRRLIQQQ